MLELLEFRPRRMWELCWQESRLVDRQTETALQAVVLVRRLYQLALHHRKE